MYIRVKTKPGSKKEEVIEEKPGYFLISVKEKAQRNMANQRILEILKSKHPRKQIKIINGHHSPIKLISID